MKKISYIFPIYNEQDNIDLLYKTMQTTTSSIRDKYTIEYIFVNDGSRDDSLEKLNTIQQKDENVTVIDFSRNYGHQIAVTAGIDMADGNAIIIMDSDMQDPPKVSLELIKKWEEGYDVVYAQRRSRKDSFFKKLSADLFYRTLQTLADIDIPRNTGDFRLIDQKVADELRRYKEHNRFLRGMVSNIGFKQTAVQFDRDERNAGETGYPLKKMMKFAADGIFSFSSTPLKAISRLGYFIAFLSVVGILYAIAVKVFMPEQAVEGWTFTVISIFFVGGVQLIMLGVLGSYIGRIYTEVQNRPLYSIARINGKQSKKQ
jgi:glycosyltransferase involved in cell wall biosynthesis